jgi:hypothetical protein
MKQALCHSHDNAKYNNPTSSLNKGLAIEDVDRIIVALKGAFSSSASKSNSILSLVILPLPSLGNYMA